MNAPLFLIIAPLAAALIVQLLRRWPTASMAVGAALIAIVRIILANTGTDGGLDDLQWTILGRTLALDDGTRQALILLYDGLLILFLVSLTTESGARLMPASLVLPAPLAAALMAEPFIYGAAALTVAAGVLVILIQAQAGSTQGALRFLVLSTLALPFLLVAGWMIESEQILFATSIGRLLLVATVILMAGFPFQMWVTPLVRSAPPYVTALLFGLVQLLIAIFLLELLRANEAAVAQANFGTAIGWSGMATALVGGLWLLRAREPEPLVGGLVLVDTGVLLLAFGIPAASTVILTLLYLRFISLTLIGVGLAALRSRPRSLVGLALFVYGALSLIGLPLTPGYSGRALALSPVLAGGAASNVDPLLALAPLLAAGVGVIALSRVARDLGPPRWRRGTWPAWVAALTGRSLTADNTDASAPSPWRDPATWRQLSGALLLLGGVLVALVPSIVLEPLSRLAALLNG